MKHFIFDVDGTITPSRKMIDLTFKKWFNEFCKKNKVWLVTGSDKNKTVEQIGEDTYNLCHTVYNCNGNDVWQGKKHLYTNEWRLKDKPHEWLSEQLTMSDFPVRAGLHFEHRPGMVNFSVVGRNATHEQRQHYVKWDKDTNERNDIAAVFNSIFTDLEAKVGGETGIDISMKGMDKSQILKDVTKGDELHFFGDAMHPEGNDYPLAQAILDKQLGFCYNIQNWNNTWKLLKDYVD
jgi:phosphomannomutase